jgi:enoyl-CoA hydratase/carnithine racemase
VAGLAGPPPFPGFRDIVRLSAPRFCGQKGGNVNANVQTAPVAAERPFVLASRDGAVLTLTMNRGERFNPLSSAMIAAIREQLAAIAADRTVQIVVLAGEGKGFCAGHDLKELRAHAGEKDWQRKLFDDAGRMMIELTRLPQPVIARVHGLATAAGCQLVSMCDLAVAAENAGFALPGVNVGVFCSSPAVGVGRNLGRKHTMEMLLTGRTIDAKTALEWGLVNRVVPAGALDAEIRGFVETITARSPAVIALGKRTFYDQIEQPLGAAYDTASESMACGMTLDDAAEGIDAFFAKRPAGWRGR